MKIEKDSSALESEIKPLLDAANTENWKDALNILYYNGSVLVFSEEMRIPCLVSLKGPVDDLSQAIDLLFGRAKTNIAPLVVAIARFFIPKVFVMMRKTEKELSSTGEMKEETAVAMFITGLIPELEKSQDVLTKAFVEGAFTLSEVIAASVFKKLEEFRAPHIHCALDEEKYEKMVEKLWKLGLIRPRLQVNLCPECTNYELKLLNYPSLDNVCPSCGTEWVRGILYTFEKTFDKIKSENLDLPLFISSYVRHRVSIQAPLSDLQIYPSAVMRISENDLEKPLEVDVYLPQFKSGIECKVYEDALAPMTKNRVGSIVGQLLEKAKKYSMVGISNVYFVTNLSKGSTEEIMSALQKAMSEEGLKLSDLRIIDGNMESLLKWLDQTASIIAEGFNKALGQGLQDALPSKSIQTPISSGGQ